MAMAMFYGWENVSGSAFIKGKNLKKFSPEKQAGIEFSSWNWLQLSKQAFLRKSEESRPPQNWPL